MTIELTTKLNLNVLKIEKYCYYCGKNDKLYLHLIPSGYVPNGSDNVYCFNCNQNYNVSSYSHSFVGVLNENTD